MKTNSNPLALKNAPAQQAPWLNPKHLSVAALAVLLAGCAQLQSVPAGTSIAEVEQKFGKPTVTCPNADGTERMIWSQQPMGQFAYGSFISKDGTIVAMKQLLTDAHFDMLSQGKWTAQQVTCEFGPPAKVEGVGKDNEIVWSYRYKQSGVWNSLMYVYMGADGKQVTHFNPGPDPMYLAGGDSRR
jgi:hypothetical protein